MLSSHLCFSLCPTLFCQRQKTACARSFCMSCCPAAMSTSRPYPSRNPYVHCLLACRINVPVHHCLFVDLSVCLSLSLYRPLLFSISHPLSLSLSIYLSLALSLSRSLSLSLSLSRSLSLSHALLRSAVCQSPELVAMRQRLTAIVAEKEYQRMVRGLDGPSVCLSLYVSLFSVCVCVCVCVCMCVYVCVCVCVSWG
jgi:hypothetical protein